MARLDRLLLVAQALRECDRPQAFTMSRIHTCGTPHCAFGHYAARRDLQQSFQLPIAELAEQIHQETGAIMFNVVMLGAWGATRPVFIWRRAIMDHFELTPVQCELIFGPSGCNDAQTAQQAAEYIERYVKLYPLSYAVDG